MHVIVPAYKAPQKLEKCLAMLRRQTAPVEIYVHDNNVNNIGFTAAVNLGLRQALKSNDEFALVLNQDVYLQQLDGIEKLTAFMRSHPRCAIAGCKQLDDQDPDRIEHAGCTSAYPQARHIVGRKSKGTGMVSLPMPWVNGAIMAVRMDAVVDFGLMDHNMFLIGSDSDWCYTARTRKWEVWYCADVEVIHEGGVTTSPPPELQAMIVRDLDYWRDKWVGSRAFERLNSWYDKK